MNRLRDSQRGLRGNGRTDINIDARCMCVAYFSPILLSYVSYCIAILIFVHTCNMTCLIHEIYCSVLLCHFSPFEAGQRSSADYLILSESQQFARLKSPAEKEIPYYGQNLDFSVGAFQGTNQIYAL